MAICSVRCLVGYASRVCVLCIVCVLSISHFTPTSRGEELHGRHWRHVARRLGLIVAHLDHVVLAPKLRQCAASGVVAINVGWCDRASSGNHTVLVHVLHRGELGGAEDADDALNELVIRGAVVVCLKRGVRARGLRSDMDGPIRLPTRCGAVHRIPAWLEQVGVGHRAIVAHEGANARTLRGFVTRGTKVKALECSSIRVQILFGVGFVGVVVVVNRVGVRRVGARVRVRAGSR
mmetsp:Transcript_81929/g.120069  ORF Transcript_81929/g.120069 Transcript_81929/m.120069 type:complete len:235 (+) Transcript_81929:225-929(+)